MRKLHKLFRYSKRFIFFSFCFSQGGRGCYQYGNSPCYIICRNTVIYLPRHICVLLAVPPQHTHMQRRREKSIYFLMTSFQQPRNVTHILVDCTFEFYDVFPLICFPGAAADLY